MTTTPTFQPPFLYFTYNIVLSFNVFWFWPLHGGNYIACGFLSFSSFATCLRSTRVVPVAVLWFTAAEHSIVQILYTLSFQSTVFICFNFLFIYLLERGDEREKERETQMWEKNGSVASHMCPNQGPNPQARHIPWLGMEPTTFHFTGQLTSNWATPIRAPVYY